MEHFKQSCLRIYEQGFYITCIIHVYREIQARNVCTPIWEENITGPTWRTKCIRLWMIALKCPGNSPVDKRRRPIQLFPTSGTLEFCCDGHPGTTPREGKRNPFALVLTDRCSKLTRGLPTANTTALPIASHFMDNWIVPYSIPTHVLTYDGTQFVSEFFRSIGAFVGTRHSTTTPYHPRTIGLAERFHKTFIARLRHYMAENQIV